MQGQEMGPGAVSLDLDLLKPFRVQAVSSDTARQCPSLGVPDGVWLEPSSGVPGSVWLEYAYH